MKNFFDKIYILYIVKKVIKNALFNDSDFEKLLPYQYNV